MELQLTYVVCVCGVVCINMYDCSQDVCVCDIWGIYVIVDHVHVQVNIVEIV